MVLTRHRRGIAWLGAVVTGALLLAGFTSARAGAITAEVRLKSARVVGDTASTAAVQKAATASQAALLGCYRANLTSHPGEVGELALSVALETTGKVGKITAVRSAVNKALRACAFKVVRGWNLRPWKARNRQLATVELVFQLSASKPRKALIRGGVPARLIAGAVEARLPTLLHGCLAGRTMKKRKYPPRLTLIVDYDGSVQTASVSGRLPRRAMRKCIVARVRLWDFPPPDNGHRTWVNYPLLPPPPRARPRAATTRPAP